MRFIDAMLGRRRLTVHDGRVECPLRGPADLEECLGCPWLGCVSRERGGIVVDCRPQRAGYPTSVPVLRPD